jgi:hypothetical protein
MVYAFCLKCKLNHGVIADVVSRETTMSGQNDPRDEAARVEGVREGGFDAAVRAELAAYAAAIEPLLKNLSRVPQPSDFAAVLASAAEESHDS